MRGDRAMIEPACWKDLNQLRRVEKLCFPKDSWPLFDLIGILTFPNVLRLKAVADDKMVGFVGIDIRNSQSQAWIATICVEPDYQRRGIASALLVESESQLRQPVIKLSVRATNTSAIKLYRKFGYREIETWLAYYRDGENALVMEKRIDRKRI
ncbi:MAG: GNAT family N-acetyltransferase [Anaerolineales bacterium]